MTLSVNGERREAAGGMTVAGLVESLGLPALAVLVEHNGLALRREEWPERALTEDDRIEIVRIVAGG